jgi:hypothetical protein
MDEYPKFVNGWIVPDRQTEDAFLAGTIQPPTLPHSAQPNDHKPIIPSIGALPKKAEPAMRARTPIASQHPRAKTRAKSQRARPRRPVKTRRGKKKSVKR